MSVSSVETIEIFGRQLKCHVCENDRFFKREAQLNTRTATMFSIDWANPSGVAVICAHCGFIHWFLPIDLLPKDSLDSK